MNKKLNLLGVIWLVLIMSCSTVYAYDVARTDVTNTIMGISKEIVDNELYKLTVNMLTGSDIDFNNNIEELRSKGFIVYNAADELLNTKNYIVDTLGIDKSFKIINYESHYCEANNSSTKDTVIIIDTLLNCPDGDILVMVEYHINKDGSIYGYNVWAV